MLRYSSKNNGVRIRANFKRSWNSSAYNILSYAKYIKLIYK